MRAANDVAPGKKESHRRNAGGLVVRPSKWGTRSGNPTGGEDPLCHRQCTKIAQNRRGAEKKRAPSLRAGFAQTVGERPGTALGVRSLALTLSRCLGVLQAMVFRGQNSSANNAFPIAPIAQLRLALMGHRQMTELIDDFRHRERSIDKRPIN